MPQIIKAKDGTELDASVVNLARSIRKVESGDKYDAKGGSGEYGAYQWMPNNYESGARELGIDPNDKSPINQDKVAYHQLKKLKDKGYSPEQVAAAWNAGEGAVKNDAWKTRKGVNKYGVAYDTPAYVNKVVGNFQQFKGAPVQQPQQTIQAPQQTPKDEKSFGRKALEFAFPILEKKERTPLQTLGDVGLSALWFVPAGGAAVSAGLRGLGVGAKAARTAGLIGAGAGTGYAADVASGLSEGKGAEALKPGLGTAIGAGTGGLVARGATRYAPDNVISSIAKENNSVFGQTKKGATELAEAFSKDRDPGRLLAEKKINLKQLIDPETVSYSTRETADRILQEASDLNEVLSEAIARTPGVKAVSELEGEMLKKIPKNAPERGDIVRKELDLLKQQYGDTPSVADLNAWKQRAWRLSKFDMAVSNEVRNTYRMIGNHLKNEIQDLANKAGVKNVDKMNDLIGSHFEAADMLERIHGTKAKGGRLGNILRESVGSTLGGVTGFGTAGPLGAIAGVIVGNYSAKVLAALIRKIEGQPIKSAILKRLEKEEPEIVRQFKEFAKRNPQQLEQVKQLLLPQKTSTQPQLPPQFVNERGIVAPSLQEAVDTRGLLKPPQSSTKPKKRLYDEQYLSEQELPVIRY